MAVQLINQTTALTGGGSTNATPVGYCHDLTLVVHPDGSLTPNAVVLGNKGDLNIARLTFDVSELESAHVINPLSEYIASVIIYDPTQERSETNPRTYPMSGEYWVVPESLLQTAVTYRCLFTLTERSSGHTTPSMEHWVSNEFTAMVNQTLWDADVAAAIEDPIIYSDTYGYLVKPPILLAPTADHYRINANSTDLGMKKDVFVKRVEFAENGLDEGFVNKYGVFIMNTDPRVIYAVKFNEITTGTYGCLIPKEVTAVPGAVQFLVVVTTETVEDNLNVSDDGFKRWVGNTLNFIVADNFLDTVSPGQSNFVLFDGSILYTFDGLTFRAKEE